MLKAWIFLVLAGLLPGCDSGQNDIGALKDSFISSGKYVTVQRALSDNPYLQIEKWESKDDRIAVTMHFKVKESLDSQYIKDRFKDMDFSGEVYDDTLNRIKSFVITLEYSHEPDPKTKAANFLGGRFQVVYTDYFDKEKLLPDAWDNQIGIEALQQIYDGGIPVFFMGVVGLVAEVGIR